MEAALCWLLRKKVYKRFLNRNSGMQDIFEVIDLVRKYWGLTLVALFFAVTLLYLLVVGDKAYIQVHDNLDSNVAVLKMLKDHGLFWSFNTTAPFLGGVNRDYLFSDLKVYSWLYMLFPTFTAFVLGWYLRILVAITGFVILGNEIYDDWKNINYFITCGLLYGILPVFPTSVISFASLPLFFCLLLKLYKHYRFKYLMLFLFYPFVSEFAVFGIFMCMGLFGLFLVYSFRRKTIGWRFISACIMLSFGYIVTEWRLFYVIFMAHVDSIRSTMVLGDTNVLVAIKSVVYVFLFGQYHSGSSHTLIVLPVVVIGWYCFHRYKVKGDALVGDKLLKWCIVAQIFCCLIYGIDKLECFHNFIGLILPPLQGFHWSRTLWFAPFLWYLAFMLVICEAKWKDTYKRFFVILASIYICVHPSTYNDVYTNGVNQLKLLRGIQVNELNYYEFYAEDMFDEIKSHIGYNGEWAVGYGFHPAVLDYNGIATLDGYYPFYEKAYKDKFRQLIAPELAIDENNRKYFDDWGGRAYVFSTDVGYSSVKDMAVKESNLYIDMEVFRNMGGKYIFSRVKISNAKEVGLSEVKVFSDRNYAYTIFVYKII